MTDDFIKDAALLPADEQDGLHVENIIISSSRTVLHRERGPVGDEPARPSKRTLRKVHTQAESTLQPVDTDSSQVTEKPEHLFSTSAMKELTKAASAISAYRGNITILNNSEASLVIADQTYERPLEEMVQEFVLWTDGSACTKDRAIPGGAAVVFKQHPHSDNWVEVPFLVMGHRDNNDIELIAIEQALQIAVEQYPQTAGQNTVVVYTDNTAALLWIKKNCISKGYNLKQILNSIYELTDELISMDCRVELRWVKGHRRAKGNVKADMKANMARNFFRTVERPVNTVTTYNLSVRPQGWHTTLKQFRDDGHIRNDHMNKNTTAPKSVNEGNENGMEDSELEDGEIRENRMDEEMLDV